MFRFTIRDMLWLMALVAVLAGIYWQQQHQPATPEPEIKTVEVYVEPN